jgi:hypothetical protein
MKTFLTILMFCGTCCLFAQTSTPPYAVSGRIWPIGNQLWSDHINAPDCDKTSFDGGTELQPKADCRKNPAYYYLYSWLYVYQNQNRLCPAPWRVPTREDFAELHTVMHRDTVDCVVVWGGALGGNTYEGKMLMIGSIGYYWTAEESDLSHAYNLFFSKGGGHILQSHDRKTFGFQIRCVQSL